ncbi:MAG: hypothetical protein U0441_38310 [Polyangiaceae bacterium]
MDRGIHPYTSNPKPIDALLALHRKATRRIVRQGLTGVAIVGVLVGGALVVRHWAAWVVCALGSVLLLPTAITTLILGPRTARAFLVKLRSGEATIAWVHAPEPTAEYAKKGVRLLTVWTTDGESTPVLGPVADVEAVLRELQRWAIPPLLTTTEAERAAEETLFKNGSSIERALAKLTGPRPLFDGVPGDRLRAALRALRASHREHPSRAAELEKRLEAMTITLMAEETRLRDAVRLPQVYLTISFAKEADAHAEALEAALGDTRLFTKK